MKGNKKRSVLSRINLVICGTVGMMIVMLIYSNIYSLFAIRDKVKNTYRSMGEHYVNELAANLNNTAEYLMRMSESTLFYGLLYSGDNQEFVQAIAKQQLYNQLNYDILNYRSVDCFYIYQQNDCDLMLVQSALKSSQTSNGDICVSLKRYLKIIEKDTMWELKVIDGHQYLISAFNLDQVIVGGIVSIDRLVQTMKMVNLSDYFVTYSDFKVEEKNKQKIQDDLCISESVNRTNAYLNIIVPKKSLYQNLRIPISNVLLFTLVLLVLLPVFFYLMKKWLIRPIRKIVKVMGDVDIQGLDTRMPDLGDMEEYRTVSVAFNHMMEKISDLKIDIYENEKKRKELYDQYTLLQINPHFFLNSLNTIYLFNKKRDFRHVQMMLTYLINYFRGVFSHTGDMILLKDEIDFTLNYMAIQKLRSSEVVHLQCNFGEEEENCYVPAMSIMTFVENSIRHSTGFSDELNLSISAKKSESRIDITVEDNGKGIDNEILNKIQKNETIIKEDREHIGIKNVVDRVKMHYGNNAKVDVQNIKPQGVRVQLNLPFMEKEL